LPSSSRYKGVVGAMVTKLLPNGFCIPKKGGIPATIASAISTCPAR